LALGQRHLEYGIYHDYGARAVLAACTRPVTGANNFPQPSMVVATALERSPQQVVGKLTQADLEWQTTAEWIDLQGHTPEVEEPLT